MLAWLSDIKTDLPRGISNMKYDLATTLPLLSRSLSPVVTVCLLSISSHLYAADYKSALSQNTDTNSINVHTTFGADLLNFSSQFNSISGNAAKTALFQIESVTQSQLLLQSYNDLQNAIINEKFSVDDLFIFNNQLSWQNAYFSQQYFRINDPKKTVNLNNPSFITPSGPIQYYQAQLASYNKDKTIMATLAYKSAQNNQYLGERQANLEADIAFYNPYKYFSRVNLNYKKSLVGIEMSQLGMGLTFYGDLNLSILSSLSIEDINNNRFPKKMNLSIGISTPL